MNTPVKSAAEVLASLREFQRRTARYAFSRLYDPKSPSLRFLVADEVGLGKTYVARGVIAQVIEHLRSIGDKRIDIVYICSNGAIAQQNLRKLNVAGDAVVTEADRFTLLVRSIPRLEQRAINLVAVTPGTSMQFGHSAGTFSERALLYALLCHIWGEEALRGSGAERVFYLGIADDGEARRRLRERAQRHELAASVIRAFRAAMRNLNEHRRTLGRPSLKVEFNRLARAFHYKHGYTEEDRQQRNRFLVELRQALATVGIDALQPDLVILDEFQRFRDLLDPDDDSWATQLARKLFEFRASDTGRPTRTLLLSATPYRPYSTADDAEGDSHFEDFVQTARFLLGDDYAAQALSADLRDLRRALLAVDRDLGAAAAHICQRVSERLRPVMARTERLASTPDRNGMLQAGHWPVTLERADVDGYLATAAAADLVGQRDVVEFWKSGPYLLNFMEGYKFKEAFASALAGEAMVPELKQLVASGRGLLNWADVNRYARLDPANARLRALMADTVERNLWQLLWLPPSLPYHAGDSIFDQPVARAFTKRLVFSAWNLVPKVISALLSHEVERRVFAGLPDEARAYGEYSQRPGRLLDFRMDGRSPATMANLNVVVPWVELARLVDPLELFQSLRVEGRPPHRDAVLERARANVKRALTPLLRGASTAGVVDQRWYWVAPLLLELGAGGDAARDWWQSPGRSRAWTGEDETAPDDSNFALHLAMARDVLEVVAADPLGRPPEDLADVIALVALASPAVCALRAFARVTGVAIEHGGVLVEGAATIAWGFRALFNGPESTAIVRQAAPTEAYWRSVLQYGLDGHLQAVLDEYLHTLKEWRGFAGGGKDVVFDLATVAASAMTLRTVAYRTDVPRVRAGQVEIQEHRMRGRFAIRFGDQTLESDSQQQRARQTSEAFNSPFWPFVLSTTSIGQEGLDFHLYSHAVVHWNLPTNPVDFEQREGRVHRFKGHAVRRNLAAAYGAVVNVGPAADPWRAMFETAAATCGPESGELQPFWVFAPPGSPARIERYVPVLPLSRDAARLESLLKAVATYRLSFGQPRQEELLRYLAGRVSPEALPALVARLRVDLGPGEVAE
ncbi:MAG: helicase-related protein [Gammaproteobacteria bacterium]